MHSNGTYSSYPSAPTSNGKDPRTAYSMLLRRWDLKTRLRGSDLRSKNLSGYKLAGADLREADLSGTNLWAADLTGANLTKTNLRNANLGYAKLSGIKAWLGQFIGATFFAPISLEPASRSPTSKAPILAWRRLVMPL